MQNEIYIRTATTADAEKIRALYAPYVQKTAISFEYVTPSMEEFANRIEHILPDHPWLVAESGNEIAGYAYAEKLYERPAYARAAETSVYVKEDCRRGGVGRKLYESMENILKRQFVTNLYACIAYRETEDGTLTRASVDFHRAMGYRLRENSNDAALNSDSGTTSYGWKKSSASTTGRTLFRFQACGINETHDINFRRKLCT